MFEMRRLVANAALPASRRRGRTSPRARWIRPAFAWVLTAILTFFLTLAGPSAFALDPSADVAKGTSPSDWIDGVIGANKDKWDIDGRIPGTNEVLPGVGLSPEMFQILEHASGEIADQKPTNDPCKLAAYNVATTKLSDASKAGGIVVAGQAIKSAIQNIMTAGQGKLAELIKDKAKDKIKDLAKEFFKKEKPEAYYYRSAPGDDCLVFVVAIWDKAAGTYEIDVYGNCDCKLKPIFFGDSQIKAWKVGTFALRITGKVFVDIAKTGDKLALTFDNSQNSKIWANCPCDARPATTVPPPPPPAPPPPKPQPYKPLPPSRTTCEQCKGKLAAVKAIDDEIGELERKIKRSQGDYDAAKSRIDAAVKNKTEPSVDDKKDLADAEEELKPLIEKYNSLVASWKAAFEKLRECEKTCGLGSLTPPTNPQDGFYVDFNGGGSWGGPFVGGQFSGSSNHVTTNEFNADNDVRTNHFNDSATGFGVGINAGADFQPAGTSFVFGPVLDANILNDQVKHSFPGGTSISSTVNFTASAQLRAGVLVMPNLLVFAQAGPSIANQSLKIAFGGPRTDTSKITPGLAIGGGAEWKLPATTFPALGTPSLFVSYEHSFWDNAKLKMPVASPGFNYSWKRDSDAIKLGVRIRFGTW
jgi:hypothetical protein